MILNGSSRVRSRGISRRDVSERARHGARDDASDRVERARASQGRVDAASDGDGARGRVDDASAVARCARR